MVNYDLLVVKMRDTILTDNMDLIKSMLDEVFGVSLLFSSCLIAYLHKEHDLKEVRLTRKQIQDSYNKAQELVEFPNLI